MKLNSYLNRIAELMAEDVDKGLVGTGTTTPTSDDTSLENPDLTTEKSVEYETSSNSVKFIYTLYSTDTNITATEFGLHNPDDVFLTRDVFPETTKDSYVDLVIEKVFFII